MINPASLQLLLSLLLGPATEIHHLFIIDFVFSIGWQSLTDAPCPPTATPALNGTGVVETGGLADSLLQSVLALLSKEVADYGRHLSQYFNLFLMYASLGADERAHLIRLNVLATFMMVALDEGPGPPIKYQYAELGKLYQVGTIFVYLDRHCFSIRVQRLSFACVFRRPMSNINRNFFSVLHPSRFDHELRF